MSRKIIVCCLFLFTIVFPLLSAKNAVEKAKPVKKSVLIVKDSSELETAVSRVVKDSLSKLGYKVKEISFTDVGKEKASLYKISIVFSAVNPGEEIDTTIQKFMSLADGKSSKVLLYTVYGKVHDMKDKNVDATTEASKELHPQLIAEHILHSLKL
jgi:hypothetical protein